MVWYDYIRGFADGQQDRESTDNFNPLLMLLRVTGAVLFFGLTVCYAVLKGMAGLVGLIVVLIMRKRR